jgi:hypothetical protein
MTPAMKVQGAYLQRLLVFAAASWVAAPAAAQALSVDRLAGGTELVVVTLSLADATTVAWYDADGGGRPPASITSGDLTLVNDLEIALAIDTVAAPPAVVAVGRASAADLRPVLDRLLVGRPLASAEPRPGDDLIEGLQVRRLGAAGSDAEIRLEIILPAPSDPRRSSIEVLWDLLPEILADDLAGLRGRIVDNRGLLEAKTDASSAELAARRLRLGLARIAENPVVRPGLVEAATERLRVRRHASLEEHPQAAERILDLWVHGGADAVREFLFGTDGVTVRTVRDAALNWLPQHPGAVVMTLPPTAFNPRFASPPRSLLLDSGLSAAVLERSGAPLATLCLRPVVVPDLDDELAATVLARIARELRDLEGRPGWVRVDARPPQILLAAPVDQFGELPEVLRTALARVAEDQRPTVTSGGSARHRALRLMAGTLGIADGSSLSPASLLRTGNLAIGVVSVDVEAASDAVRKFWSSDRRSSDSATVRAVAPVPKTREAAAGDESVLVAALDLPAVTDEAQILVLAELLASRGAALLDEARVEILQPFVPGRRVLLLVVTDEATMDVVEENVRQIWASLTGPATEDELTDVRRRVAAAHAGTWGGATGRACRCAAVASGAAQWRSATELEMAILSVPPEAVDAVLGTVTDWGTLQNVGAGVLPIVDYDEQED